MRGVAVGVISLTTTTTLLKVAHFNPRLSLASIALLFLLPVLATALAGGAWAGLASASAAALLVTYFFVPPYHSLAVASRRHVISMIVYMIVAVVVAVTVEASARSRAAAVEEAARAEQLAQIDQLRAALLDAVGHDLRSPLSNMKMSISSLREPDVTMDPDDQVELLATVEESIDRLGDLVENLLSLSRLQAGAMSVMLRPVQVDAVVAQASLCIPAHKAIIEVDVPDDLPLAYADPGLLERVVANLLDNAAKVSETILVRGRLAGDRIELKVIDHGLGVPAAERERMFTPFQRLNDRATDGLGLGLAIARGFIEAMDGTLTPFDTPGGGLTMRLTVPVAQPSAIGNAARQTP